MKKQLLSAAGILLLLAGCSDKKTTVAERSHILAVGSSTVYPFTLAVADQFHSRNGQLPKPVVQSTGTSAGIKAFCAGVGGPHPDLVDASRRIRSSELDQCRANGVAGVTELRIGTDGIAFVQSPAGRPFRLTSKQVYEALAANPYGKPNTRKRWSEISASLPDIPILVYGPPASSGTHDALAELIMTAGCESDSTMRALKGQNERRFADLCTTIRTDGPYVNTGENDEQTTIQLIVNPGAVGIFGYSFLEGNKQRLRGIAINGVAPTADSIESGRYPGARPLYLYVKSDQAARIPGLKAFVAEYAAAIGPEGYLAKRGLIAAPEKVRTQTAQLAATLTPLDPSALE